MDAKQHLYEEEGAPGWLFTYADLMTLLLVFFVLLFSLSNVESEQFKKAARSLSQALYGEQGANSIVDFQHTAPVAADETEIDAQERLAAKNLADTESTKPSENEVEAQELALDSELEQLSEDITDKLQVSVFSNAVEVGTPKNGKLTLKVKGDVLFEPGSAEFNAQMMTTLDSLVLLLKKNPQYSVKINGHTDNIPIDTPRFPSNWELSAIRATNVLRYMARGGLDLERLAATGYGESIPVASNDDAGGRALNRRLEFVLERTR